MTDTAVNAKLKEMEVNLNCDKSSGTSSSVSADENLERGNWSRKMDFVLSCLSYAVGLGNVWRFPYVCYRNGAGAFLIPFIIMLFITGIPLVFLELSFGQYASSGVVSIWKASPIFQVFIHPSNDGTYYGMKSSNFIQDKTTSRRSAVCKNRVGWAMFVVSVLIAIYYNMIIAYTLYYFFASFTSVLPWSFCGDWKTEACSTESRTLIEKCIATNGTWCNETCVQLDNLTESYRYELQPLCTNVTVGVGLKSASDEYFHKSVLDITSGVHSMGNIRWQLVLCLLLAWILVSICLAKGIKTSGKAVYFTAFFPYIVLLILLIRGLTLDGSVKGIIYFLTPQWDKLATPKVWGDAAVQIFFSLSPCWGGLITLASYNKFHNNCFMDAMIVSILDCLTSVFAGLVIFAIIGYMAEELGQDISEVASEGAGLAFVAYPEVVTKLPISQLWSVLFFSMLITLGLGTQIATVTTVHTTLLDQFPHIFRRGKRGFALLMFIAFACFIIGLAFCTQGGMYILQLFDNYAATYSLLFIGFVECIALAWVYGADRFLGDVELMLGKPQHAIWKYSWKFIAPIALLAILIFTWVDFKSTKYDKHTFPGWADGVGFLITLSSILMIPIVAVFKVVQNYRHFDGTLMELIKYLSRPSPDWGPALKEHQTLRKVMDNTPVEQFESQLPLTAGQGQDGSITSPTTESNGDTKC